MGKLSNDIKEEAGLARGEDKRRLLHWGFDAYLSVVIVVLYAFSLYFAYSLTRITSGAPAAWYVIILALVLLLMRRVVDLYIFLQQKSTLATAEETVLSFFVALLFTSGLYMLARAFRRQLTAAQETQNHP